MHGDRHPPVSIIVCAYNAQKDILDTLDSLAAQTYPKIEILIVDDASTDATSAICAEFAARDPRVRVVTHSQNQGLAHGRKTGVEEASNEFLTFIDADDIAMPNMVMRLVETLKSDDKILGVSSYRIYFDDDRDLGIQKVGPTTREAYMKLYQSNKLVFLSYPNLVRKADVLAVGNYRIDIMRSDNGIPNGCSQTRLRCLSAAMIEIPLQIYASCSTIPYSTTTRSKGVLTSCPKDEPRWSFWATAILMQSAIRHR